jgi:hypothetical protein
MTTLPCRDVGGSKGKAITALTAVETRTPMLNTAVRSATRQREISPRRPDVAA